MRFPRPFRRIGEDHQNIVGLITTTTNDTRQWTKEGMNILNTAISSLTDAVTAIHPIHMDMTQELADALLAKMQGPLTLPGWFCENLAKINSGYASRMIYHLGGSSSQEIIIVEINSDGTINLSIEDQNRERIWQGHLISNGITEIRK